MHCMVPTWMYFLPVPVVQLVDYTYYRVDCAFELGIVISNSQGTSEIGHTDGQTDIQTELYGVSSKDFSW